MNAKIWPRKSDDRGDMLMMPLVKNIPVGKKGWEKISCPECGEECWIRPGDTEIIEDYTLFGAACTMCCIKASVGLIRGGNNDQQ